MGREAILGKGVLEGKSCSSTLLKSDGGREASGEPPRKLGPRALEMTGEQEPRGLLRAPVSPFKRMPAGQAPVQMRRCREKLA